jgi:hypothetical protein
VSEEIIRRDSLRKLEVLKKVYAYEETLELVVDELLEAAVNQHRLRLETL